MRGCPTLFGHVPPSMTICRGEIRGPVLVMPRADPLAQTIAIVNANPDANGAALFTRSDHAARRFQEETEVGMLGIHVPFPVPMAFHSFGGWKISLFGNPHGHGMDGVRFYARGKVRRPDDGSAAPGLELPLLG